MEKDTEKIIIKAELVMLGTAIYNKMKKQRYNISTLSECSGVNRGVVHKIMNGEGYSARSLLKVLKTLKITLVLNEDNN